MNRTRLHECFDRHPGRYDLVHYTERAGKKDGAIEQARVAIHQGIHGDDVIRIAKRELTTDPSASLVCFAASRGDQGHFVTFTKRNIAHMLEEVSDDGRMELPDERPAAALVPGRAKPVRPVDDPIDDVVRPDPVSRSRPVRDVSSEAPAQPGTKRGKLFVATGQQPARDSLSGNLVTLFEAFRTAGTAGITLDQVLTNIGGQLTVANPKNFISAMTSRFKQAGLVAVKE